MSKKLLVYIVSYQRIEYTIGTIKSIYSVLPPESDIIVCDNGSTDGTREWLEENQEKYSLALLFPEDNLRVGGAWTLLTKYFNQNCFISFGAVGDCKIGIAVLIILTTFSCVCSTSS